MNLASKVSKLLFPQLSNAKKLNVKASSGLQRVASSSVSESWACANETVLNIVAEPLSASAPACLIYQLDNSSDRSEEQLTEVSLGTCVKTGGIVSEPSSKKLIMEQFSGDPILVTVQ